jgi:hypothetical protein
MFLWTIDVIGSTWQEGALLAFQTTNMSIADVRWSYTNSCVFALASMDGHIEVNRVLCNLSAYTLRDNTKHLIKCGINNRCDLLIRVVFSYITTFVIQRL